MVRHVMAKHRGSVLECLDLKQQKYLTGRWNGKSGDIWRMRKRYILGQKWKIFALTLPLLSKVTTSKRKTLLVYFLSGLVYSEAKIESENSYHKLKLLGRTALIKYIMGTTTGMTTEQFEHHDQAGHIEGSGL